MKESMMKNPVSVCIQMNKLLIIPMFFLTMCGTAPVTPPAGACSLPLDGSTANCPTTWPEPEIKLPREELRGAIDNYDPIHWHQMQMMFLRNARRIKMEKNMTQPEDAINLSLIHI